MLHELPIRNAYLLACHEDWHLMTPTAQGRHCQSCNREVVDFTQASAAELAAARAASPDGRVCGRLRASQLAGGRPARFGLWARAFALAVALVFGQGLTAREAWAQTRKATTAKATPQRPTTRPLRRSKSIPSAETPLTETILSGDIAVYEPTAADTAGRVYTYVEQMPQPPGGQAGLTQYLRKRLQYPVQAWRDQVEGKVFVNFVVGRDGQVSNVTVTKGLGAGCDEEALRLISQLPAWTPGRQNGRAVRVSYTVPVVFELTKPK